MSQTALARPTLVPGLVRLWRDRHTLQLGLDPTRAVLVEVADPAAVRLLDLLDGTRSERTVLEHAARRNIDRGAAESLLNALRSAGLVIAAATLLPAELTGPARARLRGEAAALALRGPDHPATPAAVLRRRRAARVVVTGHGRLLAPVALALAQAGIGHVHPDLDGRVESADLPGTGLTDADLGCDRAAAVAALIERTAPGTTTTALRRGATLVVQGSTDRPAALLAAGYAQRRQAHLLLGVRDGVPVVGPLVRPPVGPCLNCLDLHRCDRDPAWPALAAQLATAPRDEPCALAPLLTAVALATAEALTLIDGGLPDTVGGAVEVTAPGRMRRRGWPPHPDCDCPAGGG
ncbi:hypothetical protein ACK8GG_17860 [Micromonosporaceae bacterium DT55]|uniref:hypothetical protein n=1 Tax=Melissospora conviva TaxID=3388432 RepID=UPI003C1C70CF